ncbi:MAG: YkgJ family cysteine cluster protein [Desulfobulbaceae bacterium]|nr:YkgJ family cysteine cluster protein [Desulfobulbaceae bacterium]
MIEEKYKKGLDLLRCPVMPLVSMLRFLFMTGPFATVAEVIAELPEPIVTDRTDYANPKALLMQYLDILAGYEQLKTGSFLPVAVVDEENAPVDSFTAVHSLIVQQVLTRELESINSAFCASCGCTLCCTGPERAMAQEFFEIPLEDNETGLFAAGRYESAESLCRSAYDEDELQCGERPFYRIEGPGLFHWRKGWSLILPKESACPNLDGGTGRCLVYNERPQVCRRPQIFPYMLEPTGHDVKEGGSYRIRATLLAVVDCPYVRDLQDDLAEYAAACELHLVLKKNKT